MWATGAAVARVTGITVAGVPELADALTCYEPSVASTGVATLVGMLVALGIRGCLRSTPRMNERSADSHGIPTPPTSMRRRTPMML